MLKASRMFFLLLVTPLKTGVHFQFFADVHIVTFQVIQSKAKLVVWVSELQIFGPVMLNQAYKHATVISPDGTDVQTDMHLILHV